MCARRLKFTNCLQFAIVISQLKAKSFVWSEISWSYAYITFSLSKGKPIISSSAHLIFAETPFTGGYEIPGSVERQFSCCQRAPTWPRPPWSLKNFALRDRANQDLLKDLDSVGNNSWASKDLVKGERKRKQERFLFACRNLDTFKW